LVDHAGQRGVTVEAGKAAVAGWQWAEQLDGLPAGVKHEGPDDGSLVLAAHHALSGTNGNSLPKVGNTL
jgi:hypothetical protein